MGEEKDNEYASPALVKQIINDVNERRRDKERYIICSACGARFLLLNKPESCIKCGTTIDDNKQDG